MSKWVDVDACPCGKCDMVKQCVDSMRGMCDKVTEWQRGADVSPVIHATWRETRHHYDCSNCGTSLAFKTNYCPSCGATMGKEKS